MATKKQKKALKKARKTWQNMSSRQRSLAQPKGRARKKPGTTGKGDYYHVIVRPKEEFSTFRTHDIGREGHTQRVSGKRSSGSWATQKWLISKEDAYVDDKGYLRAKSEKTKKVLKRLGTIPRKTRADQFKAKPRQNVPEKDKPTAAQKKARKKNIKKAQKAQKARRKS